MDPGGGGGGQGCLGPPPPFSGEKNKGAKGATRGNILFIKVIKSRKWKNNARNIILFRCSKALYFHTFSKMFLSKCTVKNIYDTPQICSGMLKIAPKALHFLKFLGGGSPNAPPPRRMGNSPPPPPPPLRTFPAASHPVYYSTKNNSCHFYSFIIGIYLKCIC